MNQMAGTVKIKYKHTIPVNLHADMMDDFKQAINGQDIGVFFREIQEDVVEKYRQEKKVMPPAKGALINYIYNKSNKRCPEQATLDIFAKETEIVKYMQDLKEKQDDAMITKLGRNGGLLFDICKTYYRNKSKNV